MTALPSPKHDYAPAADRASSYAWVVVGLLWVVALLNYLDRLMITAMRDPIVAALKLNDAQFGLLTSVFLWVYAGVSPFGGFLADRISRRWVIIASLLFWSAATILSGFSHTFHQLLAARALMGFSEACYIPAALALIADYHPGSTRSLATGLHMSGIYTGAALGGVGGYVAEHGQWRLGFQVFGAIGIVYCFVLIAFVRDATQTNRSETAAPEKVRPAAALFALFSQPAFWFLFLANIFVSVTNWAIYGWLPTYMKEHFRLGLGAAGLSATFYIQVASFMGVLACGAWADAWSRRYPKARAWVPAIAYLIAAPCLFAAASTHVLAAAVMGLIVFGFARGAYDSNQMPILREIVDRRYSATGYGFLNFIGTAAGGIMVYKSGAMKDAQPDVLAHVFQACGIGLALVAVLLAGMRIRSTDRAIE